MTVNEKIEYLIQKATKQLNKEIENKKLYYSKEDFDEEIYKRCRLYIINQRDFWGKCQIKLKTKF